MRLDATAVAQEATTPDAYQQSTQHFRDVAEVLRKNIVQARKVGESDGKDVYSTFFCSMFFSNCSLVRSISASLEAMSVTLRSAEFSK